MRPAFTISPKPKRPSCHGKAQRALRNELKAISNTGVPAPDVTAIAKILTRAFREAEKNKFHGDPVPGARDPLAKLRENDNLTSRIAEGLRNKRYERK